MFRRTIKLLIIPFARGHFRILNKILSQSKTVHCTAKEKTVD